MITALLIETTFVTKSTRYGWTELTAWTVSTYRAERCRRVRLSRGRRVGSRRKWPEWEWRPSEDLQCMQQTHRSDDRVPRMLRRAIKALRRGRQEEATLPPAAPSG